MSLRERIAAALGWPVEDTYQLSAHSLRDLVRPVSPKLAHELTQEIQSGRYVRQLDGLEAPRWFPWALGAAAVGGVALLLRQPKDEPDVDLTPVDIDKLMTQSYEDAAFNRLIEELASKSSDTKPQVKQRYAGPLEILLEVRASWLEKAFAGDISSDVRKTATKIASQLAATCAGAPTVARFDPAIVRVTGSDNGFKVRLVWPALWGSTTTGPVRPQVRNCMEMLTRKVDPKLGARMISFTASRL